MGRGVPLMSAAVSVLEAGMQQVVLVGSAGGRQALRRVLARKYLPFAVAIDLRDEHRERLAALMPFLADMRPLETGAAAYVCRHFACQAPVADPAALEKVLL